MEQHSDFLDLILQKMPGYVLLFKPDPKRMPVFDINDDLLEKLNYDRESFFEKFKNSGLSLFSDNTLSVIKPRFSDACKDRPVKTIEIQLKPKDALKIWFSCRLTLLRDFQPEPLILAVCEDISAIKARQAKIDEQTSLISKTKVELIQELEYERFIKRITNEFYENIFEVDLTNNRLLNAKSLKNISMGQNTDGNYDACLKYLVQNTVAAESRKECLKTYSREHLMQEYKKGRQQVSFQCLATGINKKDVFWIEINSRVFMHPATDSLRCIIYCRNIDETKRQEIGLIEKAQQDSLTSLLNKKTAETMINDEFNSSSKTSKHALLMLDLDNFKKVNDSLGHAFGDKVLVEFSQEMRRAFRGNDIIGRIGGDEFVILVKNYGAVDSLRWRVLELCSKLVKTYVNGLEKYTVSASIGVALFPEHGRTYKELQKNADNALYFSKGHGKNTFTFFKKELEYNNSYLFHERDIDALINSSTDGIGKYAFDDNLSILYYNSKLLELFGFDDRGLSQEQLMNTLDYVCKDDKIQLLHVLNEALSHKSIFSHTYRIVHQQDGHLVHVRVKGMYTEELYNNKYPVFYLLYTDVSDLARQNEIISMQQKEMAIVNDMTDDLIYEYDIASGKFSMLGNDSADLPQGIVASSSVFSHYVHPDDLRESNWKIVSDLFKLPHNLFVREVVLKHNERGDVPVVVYGKRITSNDGTGGKIVGKIASREAEVKAKQELEVTKRIMASLNTIATLLISSELGTFDERLVKVLAVIASALNLDSVSIWRIDNDDKGEVYSTCLYSWAVAGMPKNDFIRKKSDITKEEADRWYDTMKKNRSFITSISKATNEKDKQALQRYDFFSIYMLPIHIDGTLWGYFELGDATKELNFSEHQVGLLKMNAQLISLSIQERLKKQ